MCPLDHFFKKKLNENLQNDFLWPYIPDAMVCWAGGSADKPSQASAV